LCGTAFHLQINPVSFYFRYTQHNNPHQTPFQNRLGTPAFATTRATCSDISPTSNKRVLGAKQDKKLVFLACSNIVSVLLAVILMTCGIAKSITKNPVPLAMVSSSFISDMDPWVVTDIMLNNYNPHPPISMAMAV
jgi:hypothetical protein